MDVLSKLEILTDAAKYDAACTSSGSRRGFRQGHIGNTSSSVAGCCHTFSADGRCVTLLKVLMSNCCVYDCAYCVNRRSNDTRRAAFTPEELADLTINFYRRNYIEGLFLSSGVLRNPDYTMEQMIRAIRILRETYRFNGYIHAKAIPGAAPELVEQLGLLVDRLSCNIELPSEAGLRTLAPEKTKSAILAPMRQIQCRTLQNKEELVKYRHKPKFAPAGQSTQMIIGASGESDYEIVSVAESLYQRFELKRVFYSAFVRVNDDSLLPALPGGPPLLREHRLYQADWLMRFYGFEAGELLSEKRPNFNVFLDPKCDWAIGHLEQFPVEILEDERVDDLQRNGYHIIQKRNGFCFGMDAVLLAGFARVNPGERAIDLGTGTGIIPILLEARYEGEHYTGLEIQEEVAEMARRSVRLNGLEDKVDIALGDIKEASVRFGRAQFDVVTSNPPYMNDAHGLKNPDLPKAIARHEVLCTLDDVVREAAGLLKPGGRFYMVHRPHRLIEIINTLTKYKLEPKRMKLVHPFVDKDANMVLIEAVRGGKSMIKVEAPIVVYKEQGVYTDEIYDIYGY